ncbi:hypothetical protein N7491_004618 [Penicillium cf. griseofulvum]|uniref:Uncharacterized protein n=1 Tax=Penicillium cf. griseofulvum TaxID=2972120 RepID=A0A9W9J091_9EURO|nr:hypothetical protein N7472_007308 [Penicillium cf. griseofulvum]KAJ5434023.1 hypothetical protein N7491_004618 [Penicillium cf. griseofulvum]KAJ5451855.1 hypothetical protein N7445_000038 [Penicillium cf. griseofulvum]
MGDALRPTDDEFSKVLQQSLTIWTSYLGAGNKEHLIPRQAINMRPLVIQTLAFLGGGLTSLDKTISFACEGKESHVVFSSMAYQRGEPLNGRLTYRQRFY